ncbi:E3 ubiquitin-protein ligase ptr1 [Astathelohania contejeani]|uniref:HECT-type E3 ubiquitin transferase n=1 Tax=Astathelohania contejeani TaxID=164912 RepID=A0ABQ7HWP5_9MICR|nr:E3 ubiquitin-protein ligase ptr1 [Thelohania contejeani]
MIIFILLCFFESYIICIFKSTQSEILELKTLKDYEYIKKMEKYVNFKSLKNEEIRTFIINRNDKILKSLIDLHYTTYYELYHVQIKLFDDLEKKKLEILLKCIPCLIISEYLFRKEFIWFLSILKLFTCIEPKILEILFQLLIELYSKRYFKSVESFLTIIAKCDISISLRDILYLDFNVDKKIEDYSLFYEICKINNGQAFDKTMIDIIEYLKTKNILNLNLFRKISNFIIYDKKLDIAWFKLKIYLFVLPYDLNSIDEIDHLEMYSSHAYKYINQILIVLDDYKLDKYILIKLHKILLILIDEFTIDTDINFIINISKSDLLNEVINQAIEVKYYKHNLDIHPDAYPEFSLLTVVHILLEKEKITNREYRIFYILYCCEKDFAMLLRMLEYCDINLNKFLTSLNSIRRLNLITKNCEINCLMNFLTTKNEKFDKIFKKNIFRCFENNLDKCTKIIRCPSNYGNNFLSLTPIIVMSVNLLKVYKRETYFILKYYKNLLLYTANYVFSIKIDRNYIIYHLDIVREKTFLLILFSYLNNIDKNKWPILVSAKDEAIYYIKTCPEEFKLLQDIFFNKNIFGWEGKHAWLVSYSLISLYIESSTIIIDRNDIFKSTLDCFDNLLSVETLKSVNFRITFIDEEGVDVKGLTKYWIVELCKHLVKNEKNIFECIDDKSFIYLPKLCPKMSDDRIKIFRFIGKIIGRAVLSDIPFPILFTDYIYKMFIENECSESQFLSDRKDLVLKFSQLEALIADGHDYFDFDIEIVDSNDKIDRIYPCGEKILTLENFKSYKNEIICYGMDTGIKKQLNILKEGILEILNKNFFELLKWEELKLVFSGVQIIDIDDWKKNTLYEGYTATSNAIILFWKYIESLSINDQMKFIEVTMGIVRLPVGGFGALFHNFKIYRLGDNQDYLPTVNSCFNRLNLPDYETYDILESKISYFLEVSHLIGFELS